MKDMDGMDAGFSVLGALTLGLAVGLAIHWAIGLAAGMAWAAIHLMREAPGAASEADGAGWERRP